MKTYLNKLLLIAIMACFMLGVVPAKVEAKFLAHATRRPFAAKIIKGRFSTTKMKPARFGKRIYLSNNIKTAIKEKPKANSIMLFKKSKMFKRRILDTTRMSSGRLKKISRLGKMRGTIKKGVLGPKIGKRIGRYADRNNLIIKYKSARYKKDYNFGISSKLYRQHPKIIRYVRTVNAK